MPFDVATHGPILAIIAFAFLAVALARRVPVLRTIVSIATWVLLIGVLVVVLGERERFDPYLGRVAALLNLQDQKVEGAETRIRMAPDGHFWVRVAFGGVERRMLVDSGATLTALSVGTATAARLEVRPTPFPMLLRTANGTIRADTSEIAELRMGNIVARDVPVVVSSAFGETDILGMNFLSRLKSWRVEGRTLVLVPHNPQPVE